MHLIGVDPMKHSSHLLESIRPADNLSFQVAERRDLNGQYRLPSIDHFIGKTIVIKCGGAAMIESGYMQKIMQDIVTLHHYGVRPVIVHGGGPEITALCQRLEVPTAFINGQRVTDEATLEIVQMVLFGKTNRNIVSLLNQLGVKAVGISGQDAGIIQAKKYVDSSCSDIGFVGEIFSVDQTLISKLLEENYLPVISPIGIDKQGQAYNINADTVAGAIATALSAEKLIFLSDVDGFYADSNDPTTRISSLKIDTIKRWLQVGLVSGGMIPKLRACLQAINDGVSSAHILDGKIPRSLLDIFSNRNVGTHITA